MSNKILIVQIAVGPTYKERLLYNINTYDSYNFFDVFILTEDVEYFSSIANRPNIIIKDVNEIRKDFPLLLELEKVPPKIDNEADYGKFYIEQNFKFPTLVERFVWYWEGAENYDGFIFMSCDVVPVATQETYTVLENYFCNPVYEHSQFKMPPGLENRLIVVPGGSAYDEYHHPFLKEFAIKINEKYKVTTKPIEFNFLVTDGNFRTWKFPNKQMIKPFFHLINNIILDVLTDSTYYPMHIHSMWNINAEYVYSIVLNFLDAVVVPLTTEWGLQHNYTFLINCYPEDRFWNFGYGMEDSVIGKQDYINRNYDKLKEFYGRRGQEFPYERPN